jgi:threonine dehydrogenase-like Zn-dependent dehydrogenase
MRAIVLTAPGRLEMGEVPTPQPRAGEVRIRTAACGVCATDLAMIDGNPRVRPPAILGHEWSGVVDAVGRGVEAALVGRRCVAENVLAGGGEVGFEYPGGYGEFLVTAAANVQVLPDDFDLAAAALIEPLAVCVRAMGRLGLTDKRAALIFGDGAIGLLMLALLKRAGVADVTLVGGRAGRLALARELGATQVLDYHEASCDLAVAIAQAVCHQSRASGSSDGPFWPAVQGFVNVVEASGSAVAMQAALDLASPGGKVLLVGDYGEARADFPWNLLLHHELQIIGSNASAGAWPEAVRLATAPSFPLARLVSARLPAARFAEAIDLVRSRRGDVVKVIMEWT